jgi:hypothetical protein
MIDREHDLPITKQAEVLRISRGSVYYLPRPVPEADLAIMRRLDRLHLEFPFAGSRMLRDLLAAEGCKIGRRHVKTLMKRMGIEALEQRHLAPVIAELGDELADEMTVIVLGNRASRTSRRECGGGNKHEGASVHGLESG